MSNCTICNDTTPAPVSTVTVNTNTIAMDGTDYSFVDEILSPVASVLTLTNTPLEGSLKIMRNNAVLTPDVAGGATYDYALVDDTVTLHTAPEVGDVYRATYLAIL